MNDRWSYCANLNWLFTEHPFERRFDAAAAAGFAGVEFPSPYGHPAGRLRSRLDDAGLQQVLINTPAGPVGSVTERGVAAFPDRVHEFREGVGRAIDYATDLGCSLIHVMAGEQPEDVSFDLAFATYVVNIAWAAEAASAAGVELVLEALNQVDAPRFFLSSAEQAAAVASAVGAPVGLLFDVYHAQIEGGDVSRRLGQLIPVIRHIQVADPPTRHEPGAGELSWGHFFDQLAATGYDRWVGCEYRPTGTTEGSLSWIQDRGARPAHNRGPA